VIQKYKEISLPFTVFEMENLDEKNIGKYMETMMQIVSKLGAELGVNVLDQEEIENYKKSNI
jgi:uncharacterized protein (DUF1330 family)